MNKKVRLSGYDFQRGFSVIELLIIVVITVILLVLVAWQYTNISAHNRDTARKNDIKVLQEKLSEYYAVNAHYPEKLSAIKDLNDDSCRDPRGHGDCTHPDYVYRAFKSQTPPASANAGADCDNKAAATFCYSYILYSNSMEDTANPYLVSGD